MFDSGGEPDGQSMRQIAPVATIPRVAAFLGCPVWELEDAIEAGRLPIVPISDVPMIHDADLERFLEEGGLGVPRSRLGKVLKKFHGQLRK